MSRYQALVSITMDADTADTAGEALEEVLSALYVQGRIGEYTVFSLEDEETPDPPSVDQSGN